MIKAFSLLTVCLALLVPAHTSWAQDVLAAVRIDGVTTAANFTIGLSRVDSTAVETTALVTDQVRMTGSINPEPAHLGQQADIFLVVRIGNSVYMRNQDGVFVPWNGMVATLTPYRSGQSLAQDMQLELFAGNIPVTGKLEWFLGYKSSDGVLIYNRTPHLITIAAQNASWPPTRPYIALTDFAGASSDSTAFRRFFGMVDRWVGGTRNEYNYSAIHTMIAYALNRDERYLQSAIADVDAYVNKEIAIACNTTSQAPGIAYDSYLYAGDAVQRVALAYDYGYDLLTDDQRARWLAFMEQTVGNIFGDPARATWGGPAMGCATKTVPWSGWSVTPPYGPNPGNNYYFSSFAKAAMTLALATRDQKWLDLAQLQVRPTLAKYYAEKLPDGGSREGTGYGVAHSALFDNYRMWKASTGEDWSQSSSHARNTIIYWLHATLPTLDRYVPIGDQARVSYPELYDYHRGLMLEAQLLSEGTSEARQAHWWLDNISVKRMSSGFNSHLDLLKVTADSEKPTQLSYYAKGAGVYFARSSWERDATFFSIIAGQYEESHAAQEQGNFVFYKDTWLAVTSNIWSRSGIQQGSESRNVLRFERTNNGVTSVIGQNMYADTLAPVISEVTDSDGTKRGSMDLSPAFSRNRTLVQSWQRDFAYKERKVTIHDVCRVAAGVTPVWQVHVPAQPIYNESTGSIAAGRLTITPRMPTQPTVVIEEMNKVNAEYAAGRYRVSLYSNSGCDFTVDLEAQ